jgi:putative transposase
VARPLRIHYPGAWYPVASRGNERRRIFADDQDWRKFLGIVAESVESFGIQVHCYLINNKTLTALVLSETRLGGLALSLAPMQGFSPSCWS